MEWVVEFGCGEAVIRTGTLEEAWLPDDLGCEPTRIRELSSVQIREVWDKNGCLRCELCE